MFKPYLFPKTFPKCANLHAFLYIFYAKTAQIITTSKLVVCITPKRG